MRHKATKWELTLCLGVAFLILLIFALGFAAPRSSPVESEDVTGKIVIRHAVGYLFLALLAAGALNFVVGVWVVIRGKTIGWLPLGLSLCSPLLCCASTSIDDFTYGTAATIKDRDGTEYLLLTYVMFQAKEFAIVRLKSETVWETEYELLAKAPKEYSGGFLAVVSPEPPLENSALYLTSNRILVGVASGYQCYAAFDLNTQMSYTQCAYKHNQPCHDVKELSPFLLMGPETRPSRKHFKELLEDSPGRARLPIVEAEIANPNPEVQAMARELAKAIRADG